MCGIAGLYSGQTAEQKTATLERLSNGLQHRGPDGKGFYQDEQVGLAHTRLSIIDLSESGNQPLYNEDKSLVLICNGEIYNYRELTEELKEKGHQFSSHSDSETILHLYEEYRDDIGTMLNKLTGMFAFALWDKERDKLIVARDRIGIKPLYYSLAGGNFMFASEVKPLVKTGLVSNQLDYTSLYEYFLLSSIPAPNTIYAAIKTLEPGHYMAIGSGKIENWKYWDVDPTTKNRKSMDEVVEDTGSLFSEVVKDHLVSDVPVGTFLSAGIDSSLITAYASEHQPGINTFTASFPGEPEDEVKIASDTSKRLNVTHHAYELKDDFFKGFDEYVGAIDQPLAVISSLSLSRISQLAKQHVKVVLSGDGADELFGGYDYRHHIPPPPSFLKNIAPKYRGALLKAGAKLTGKKSLSDLANHLEIPLTKKYLDRLILTTPETVKQIMSPDVWKDVDEERYSNHIQKIYTGFDTDDELNKLLYVDVKTTLVDEMLTKCDRMTMMNGIEGRVPFLDHRMVELAFSIPSKWKRNENYGKLPLRHLLEKKLGHELAFRKKTGFNSPLKKWLTEDDHTRNFVQSRLQEMKGLPFLNADTLNSYAKDITTLGSQDAFSLMSLNHYFVKSVARSV